MSFEREIENLERVVGQLERGDLALEEALRQYESGHQSLRRCYLILERAQRRIEVLSPPGAWRPIEAVSRPPEPGLPPPRSQAPPGARQSVE